MSGVGALLKTPSRLGPLGLGLHLGHVRDQPGRKRGRRDSLLMDVIGGRVVNGGKMGKMYGIFDGKKPVGAIFLSFPHSLFSLSKSRGGTWER